MTNRTEPLFDVEINLWNAGCTDFQDNYVIEHISYSLTFFSRTLTADEDNNEIITYYALRWRLSVVRRLELYKAHHVKIKKRQPNVKPTPRSSGPLCTCFDVCLISWQ